jgi:hypothetical protein
VDDALERPEVELLAQQRVREGLEELGGPLVAHGAEQYPPGPQFFDVPLGADERGEDGEVGADAALVRHALQRHHVDEPAARQPADRAPAAGGRAGRSGAPPPAAPPSRPSRGTCRCRGSGCRPPRAPRPT